MLGRQIIYWFIFQRFVNQNAGSGSGSNRGQRQSTQNYPQQQQSYVVPNPIFQHPIYIQPTFVPNQHRMPNSNQQPQQFVQPIQYTQNYVSSTNQQPMPYINQSYQPNTYPQTNQPHQPVVTQHVTQTQQQNNPYPQPTAQHQQMLVQNTTIQREKKIIKITDPSTGKSLNEEIRTNRMSSPSVSATNQGDEVKEQTVETADERKKEDKKICQEFAAMVAVAARKNPQSNQNEDSKNKEISKDEATIETSEDPKNEMEKKTEEKEETTEIISDQSEEKPEEPEPKPTVVEETTVDEKTDKEVPEDQLPESDDKDSKF